MIVLLHNDTFNNKKYCFVVATCVRVLLQIVAIVRSRKPSVVRLAHDIRHSIPTHTSLRLTTERLTTERLTTERLTTERLTTERLTTERTYRTPALLLYLKAPL